MILTIINKLESLKWYLLNIYESYQTALIPQKLDNKTNLQLNFKQFYCNFTRRVFNPRKGLSLVKSVIKNSPRKNFGKKPLIVHLFPNIDIGGSIKIAFDIINHLNNNYEFEIISLAEKLIYNCQTGTSEQFISPNQLKEILLKKGPSIIHLHYYGDIYGFILHAEELLESNLNCIFVENSNNPIQVFVHPKIKKYIFVSKFAYKIQTNKPNNSTIIYPGVDLELFKPAAANNPQFDIGCIYRLDYDKLDLDSIDIIIQIVIKRPKTKILIIGEGPLLYKFILRTLEKKVRNNFYFRGECHYSTLPKLFDMFKIFLSPVNNESYGVVHAYALAKNIPVISPNIGAIPEIIGNNGIICQTKKELVHQTIKLLDNPRLINKVAKNARLRTKKNFDLKRMIKKYNFLYRKIANID